MSSRPKRNSSVPAKFTSLSGTINKLNGDGGRRTPRLAAAAAPDAATEDSRSSTPVSCNSSSAATTRSRSSQKPTTKMTADRTKQRANKPKARKSRSLMQDVVDDDECDNGLEALDDESCSESETSDGHDEMDDLDDETAGNDDMEGSLADDNVSTVWSEATADSVSVASNIGKLPRRPKSPEFIPDVEVPTLDLPSSSTDLCISGADVMLAVSVYEVLRRFRAMVRLSPFRFEDFCTAVSATGVDDYSVLIVEIHTALIRALLREDDGNNTTFGPYDTKDSIAIAMHFVDAMTWYECTRSYLDSDPLSVEFCAALPMVGRTSYSVLTVNERLRLLRTLADLLLATNAVREELTNEGNIHYDDHCRSCHRLGDLLCCDTCPAVYHLSCLENPLAEVPEEEWQCSICKLHQLKGVTDCLSDVEKSGLLCRQEPIGYDRHRRKYWFICRRIIVESENESETCYYSTVPQLEELLETLDADNYEHDLVQAIAEMREDIDRQMKLTEELTHQVQAGRKSMIDVLNEAILKKRSQKTAPMDDKSDAAAETIDNAVSQSDASGATAEDSSSPNAVDTAEHNDTADTSASGQPSDKPAINGETSTSQDQIPSADSTSTISAVPPTTGTISTPVGSKMLCVVNKDGSKTFMTLVSGKNLSKPAATPSSSCTSLASVSSDATLSAEARRNIVTRSKTGSLAPKQFTDSILTPTGNLKTAIRASLADHVETDSNEVVTRGRSAFTATPVTGYFKLGMEGKYKHYQNLYRTNSLALNKNQHVEERDKKRIMSHKFSLTAASEFSWNGSTFGAFAVLIGTLRATILQLESNIPTPFLHPNWSLHRARWLKQVNACSQPEDFGAVLSTFEAVIKPVVFNQVWHEALGHVRLRRCPMLDRDETRKKEKEQRKRKVDEDEELQCKNTWVKYTLGIRHSVYKQKGEEYRITGQGGWLWVSAMRTFRVVPAESVGLRSIAAKLWARKLKRQAAGAAGTSYDTSADPTLKSDENSVDGVTVSRAKDASLEELDKLDSKTGLKADTCSDCENNEVKVEKMETDADDVKNETTSDEKPSTTDDVKTDVASEANCRPNKQDDILPDTSISETKPDDDDNIEVSEVSDALCNYDEFSVSEALINRTHYPRFTKPYSRLEHLLDRRLAQLQIEQKQRLICEQLIARFRSQDTQRKSSAVDSDISAKVSSMDLEEASSSKLDQDDAETSSTVRYVCYSAVCRAQGECGKQTCYSVECRQRSRRRTTPTPSLALEASDDDLTDSGVEDNEDLESSSAVATRTDAAAAKAEKKLLSVVARSAETTDSEASLCNDVTPADSDEAKNVNSKPAADVTFANCLSTLPSSLPASAPAPAAITSAVTAATIPNNAIPRSRIGRFKTMKQIQAAAAAAANIASAADNVPVARPVSPSLSLQKYMQDGKILLTADLVSVLESKLAIHGQSQYKSCLPKRAGPGRPSAKGSGNLVSRGPPLQKKLALPPVHRFWAGRVSKRSLFAIERQVLRSVGRREGRRECPGFNYNCKMVNVGWPYPCPRPLFRTAWRYRTQTLTSIAGAALQLRIMWACIRWDDIVARIPAGGQNTVTTDTDITTTELLKKRDIPPLGLHSEYLVRKLVVPINVPTTQPREKYTPQRSGLRERRRAESPKNKEPSVTEVWLSEEQLDLWQIKYFAEKIEKQKASAHDKLPVQQKQPAALEAASTTTVVSSLKPTGTLTSQLESDLKLQRVAMAQKRLQESQTKNMSTAAASSGQSLVATPSTPVSGARLAGLQPRSLLAGQSTTSSSSPSVQNLRITQGVNGQLQVQGLLPGQQIMRLPDGRLHLISSTSTQAKQPSTVTIPAHSSTVTLPPRTSITLPQTARQTVATPRTLLVGGPRVISLSSLGTNSPTASPQLVIAGSASGSAGTQLVTLNVAGGTSSLPTPGRPRLAPSVQQPTTTLIRMPSGQQLLVRPSQIVTLGQQRPGASLLTGPTMLGISPGGSTLLPASALSSPKSPATGSSGYAVTPQVVQQVVSRALLQTQDPGIQAKLLAMQKQMQQVTGTILLPPEEDLNMSDRFTSPSFAGRTSASHGHDLSATKYGKTLTHEQKEEQTRMAACMQVMKSLLDSIERQERTEQKRQRKQETSDERLKRISQQKLEALLVRQKENLKKDILKKRSLLEREITSDIQSEISAALAARHSRNVPMLAVAATAPVSVTTSPARKRRSDVAAAATPASVPSYSAAYEAAAAKPQQLLHTPPNTAASEQKPRRGRQKTTMSTTGGSTVQATTAVSTDTQLYCLCQTPYDDSKFYIGCDKCEDWFHGSCVGVTKSEADQMDSYVCPRCRESSDSKNSAARTPLHERQFAELRKLVLSLRAHRMSWPFLEPVNASEVPDYYIVIKEPVDLQTIQSRIDYRQYTCFNDFVKDVTKMFDNCRYYNAPNTPFYRCADSLEAFFVEKLKSFKGKM